MPSRDTRIVEMQFDNRNFERNIAKSQRSLEDFKRELNFEDVSKGLTQFTSGLNKLTFDGLADNIQRIADKFTGLGDAGEYALSRIRYAIESAAMQLENFIKSFTSMQISVGQGKYDALNKAVQTIIAGGKYTEDQAYSVFERLMQYTDQTSANFTDMVHSITNFTSVGQSLTESEKALEGIFNMSAKAGQGVTEASYAMSAFSKAMGQGYLDLHQWYSLNSTAYIVTEDFRKTILETAVATGDLIVKNGKYFAKAKNGMAQVEVTADNLERTLNRQWLSKKTMMALFDKYYFAKLVGATNEELSSFAGVAYQSAQKALTFSDAIGAVREAVSSGWLTTFRKILGDVSESMKFFTDLCERVIDAISGISDTRNKVLQSWLDSGGRDSFISIIFGDYGKEIETGAYGIIDLFEGVGNLISQAFWDMLNIFASGGERNLWNEDGFKEAWLGVKLSRLTKGIQDFIGSIRTFFTEEIEVNGKVTSRLEMIHKIVDGIVAILALGWMTILGVVHFVSGLKRKLQPSIDTIGLLFSTIADGLTEAAKNGSDNKGIISFFDKLLEDLTPLTDSVNEFVTTIGGLLIEFIQWGRESGFFAAVGDVIIGVFRGIAKFVSNASGPLLTFFTDTAVIISDLIKNGFSEEALKKAGPKLAAAFKTLLTSMLDAMPDSLGGIRDAIKDLFGLWGDDVDRSDSFFTAIHDMLQGGYNTLKNLLTGIFSGLEEFNFHDLFSIKMGLAFTGGLLRTMIGWFTNANFYKVLMALLGVAVVAEIFRLVHNVTSVVTNIKNAVKEIRFNDYGDYLLKFAEGIALIVASVVVIGAMDPAKVVFGFFTILMIMTAIGTFIMLMQTAAGKLNKSNIGNQLSMAAQIVAIAALVGVIAAGVALIALAIIPLTKLGWGAMIRALLLVAGFVAVLFGGIFLMLTGIRKMLKENRGDDPAKAGKNETMEMLKISAMLLVLSVAVGVLATAISAMAVAIVPLASLGWGAMLRAMILVAWFLGVLGGGLLLMVMAIKKIFESNKDGTINTKEMLKVAGIMLLMSVSLVFLSVAIGVLALAILPLAAFGWDTMGRALILVTGFLLIIGGFIVGMVFALKKLSKDCFSHDGAMSGRDIGKIAALMLAMSASMVILSVAIAAISIAMIPFAVMDIGSWGQALGAFVIILGGIGLFIVAMLNALKSLIGDKKKQLDGKVIFKMIGLMLTFSVMMVLLAGAIVAISMALVPFATMESGEFQQAMIAFIVIMAGIGVFLSKITDMVGEKNKSGAGKMIVKYIGILMLMVGLAGVMMLFSIAINMLGAIEQERLIPAVLSIGAIMIVLFALIDKVSDTKLKTSQVLLATVLMLAVAGMAILLSFALNEVKHIKWEVIAAFTVGVSALIIAAAGAIKIAASIPSFGAGIKAILLIALGIAAIVGVLALVIPLLLNSVGNSLMDFSAKLQLIGPMLGGFSSSMGEVDEGGMDKADNVLDRLLAWVQKIVAAGDIVTPMRNLNSSIFNLASAMDKFIYQNGRMTDPKDSNIFKTIDKLVEIQGTIQTLDFSDFPQKVFDLAVAFAAFDYVGSEMDPPENSPLVKMIQTLSGSSTGLQTLADLKLGNLIVTLRNLGGALAIYAWGADQVTGIQSDKLPSTESAVGFLNQVIAELSGENGEGLTLPEIPQETAIGTFGTDLAALAGAVQKYVDACSGFGEGTDKAIAMMSFLVDDLKPQLTKDNLAVTSVFDDADVHATELGTFAGDLVALGVGIGSFAKESNSALGEGNKVDKALEVLSAFADLKTKITYDDMVAVWGIFKPIHELIYGKEYTLEMFSNDISDLGFALSKFATDVNFDSPDQVDHAIALLGIIQKMVTELPKSDGVTQVFMGQQNLNTYAAGIGLLGSSIASLMKSVMGIGDQEYKFDSGVLTGVISLLQAVGYLYDVTSNIVRDWRLGGDITPLVSRFKDAVTAMVVDLASILADPEVRKSIYRMLTVFAQDLTDLKSAFGDISFNDLYQFTMMLTSMFNMFASMVKQDLLGNISYVITPDDFKIVGGAIPSGIALGIRDGTAAVEIACSDLGAAARAAFAASIDSNSPSKVFREIGTYIPQGIGLGIKDDSSFMTKAIDNMSDDAKKEAMDLLSAMAAALSEDTDMNPVITPIIDLTDIKAGTEKMRSLIDGENGSVIDTYIASRYTANSMPKSTPTTENQNGSDYSGIYARLNTIDTTLADLGDKISKMKLVLNTGELVGGIIDSVDTELGQRTFLERRRG